MHSIPPLTRYTPEQYLLFERAAEYKNEYSAGQIRPMHGVGIGHNQITANITGNLYGQLKKRLCVAYVSMMRVRIGNGAAYFYPDVVAVCGEPQFEDDQVDTLTNPTVIIEVLSQSTEKYDRGEKFRR